MDTTYSTLVTVHIGGKNARITFGDGDKFPQKLFNSIPLLSKKESKMGEFKGKTYNMVEISIQGDVQDLRRYFLLKQQGSGEDIPFGVFLVADQMMDEVFFQTFASHWDLESAAGDGLASAGNLLAFYLLKTLVDRIYIMTIGGTYWRTLVKVQLTCPNETLMSREKVTLLGIKALKSRFFIGYANEKKWLDRFNMFIGTDAGNWLWELSRDSRNCIVECLQLPKKKRNAAVKHEYVVRAPSCAQDLTKDECTGKEACGMCRGITSWLIVQCKGGPHDQDIRDEYNRLIKKHRIYNRKYNGEDMPGSEWNDGTAVLEQQLWQQATSNVMKRRAKTGKAK